MSPNKKYEMKNRIISNIELRFDKTSLSMFIRGYSVLEEEPGVEVETINVPFSNLFLEKNLSQQDIQRILKVKESCEDLVGLVDV